MSKIMLLVSIVLSIEPRVPYYISVVAVNQIGERKSAIAIVFTKTESKILC